MIASALVVSACSDEPVVVRKGMDVVPGSATLTLRAADTTSTRINGAPGISGSVRWSSTDSTIVEVDAASTLNAPVRVRAVAPGQASLKYFVTTSEVTVAGTIPVTVLTAR